MSNLAPLAHASWQPLLANHPESRAWELVHEIARALRDPSVRIPAKPNATHYSLGSGAAGIALFFAYLHRAEPTKGHDDVARDALDEAANGLESVDMRAGLYAGISGVAWAVAHLRGMILPEEDEGLFEAIDDALEELLEVTPWTGNFDLVEGLVGYAVYALERLPDPRAESLLERIVEHLDQTARRTADGVAWWTSPHLLHPVQQRNTPEGYYNLGVAHGIPGVIALLSRVAASGVARSRCSGLAQEATRWLLRQQLPAGLDSRFGAWKNLVDPPSSARMAWCYGDPGIAVALHSAARHLEQAGEPRPPWADDFLQLARESALRPAGQSLVADTPLCHGSIGLAHLYNRMRIATGEEVFERAARFWIDYTFEHLHPDLGIAGFASSEPGGWKTRPGFLGGAAGAGLALLAAVTPIAPEWDRILLASIPVPGGNA